MADVSISVMDFAEDIAEPIVPILDALGMIGGDGNDLDLDGWTLEKALGFVKSYQRTTAILSILDMIESLPPSYIMYRNEDGHVTDESSNNSVEEHWYPFLEFGDVEIGLTLNREMKPGILADGTNAQKIFIGLFGKIQGLNVGGHVNLDLALSIPIIKSESDGDGSGNDTFVHKFLFTEDATGEEHLAAVSIQASVRGPSYPQPLTAGSMSCESIDLCLAIGRAGVDIDLNLVNFSVLQVPLRVQPVLVLLLQVPVSLRISINYYPFYLVQ